MIQQAMHFAAASLALVSLQGFEVAGEIVDSDYVADALKRGAIVWDARGTKTYLEGHIPGARNVGDIAVVLRNPNTEDWLPVAQVEAILGSGGIDPAKKVIVYSHTGDTSAYFGLSTLRYFGGQNAKVYHGGFEAWKAAGRPVVTEPIPVSPIALQLAPVDGVVIWNDEMVARVREGSAQIVDVRTAAEYTGNDIRAIRGSHIPHAINIPYEHVWVDPATAARHVASAAPDPRGLAEFYEQVLGFRTSDWCNVDHHTVNFVRAPQTHMHHIAFEMRDACICTIRAIFWPRNRSKSYGDRSGTALGTTWRPITAIRTTR